MNWYIWVLIAVVVILLLGLAFTMRDIRRYFRIRSM